MYADDYVTALQYNAIRNTDELAKLLAGKAHILASIIRKNHDLEQRLRKHFESLTKFTLPDINNETFSDVYVQTLTYGMFVARNHHKEANIFTRVE